MDIGESETKILKTFFHEHIWPWSMLVCGSSQCGKTTFILNLIRSILEIHKGLVKVVYFYGQYQTAFDSFKEEQKNVTFSEDIFSVDDYLDGGKVLVIFDDLMLRFEEDSKSNYFLRHFYTVRSHHSNCSVITIIHNAFPKKFRVISLNSSFLVLFKNNRDNSFVHYINRQINGSHSSYLLDALNDATKIPYKYLVLDFLQGTPEILRVRNFVFPSGFEMTNILKCYVKQ